jgi:hypothetical protein
MAEDGISEHELKEALLRGMTTPDGQDVVWREKDGVRVVILRKPTPFKGPCSRRRSTASKQQRRRTIGRRGTLVSCAREAERGRRDSEINRHFGVCRD